MLMRFWVRLSYEKLHDFYYCCGIIGHGHRECEKWLGDKEKFEVLGLPYGQWLRAQISGTRYSGSKQQQQQRQQRSPNMDTTPLVIVASPPHIPVTNQMMTPGVGMTSEIPDNSAQLHLPYVSVSTAPDVSAPQGATASVSAVSNSRMDKEEGDRVPK